MSGGSLTRRKGEVRMCEGEVTRRKQRKVEEEEEEEEEEE